MTADDQLQRRFDLGRALLHRREQRAVSQDALAEMVQCDRKTISRIENGEHATSVDRLFQITRALGITIGDLEADIAAMEQQRENKSVSE